MKKILELLIIFCCMICSFSSFSATTSGIRKLANHLASDQGAIWTEAEMEIVNQYGLRTNDNRGISFVSAELGNLVESPDLKVNKIKEGLVFYMTTGVKKDLIFVQVSDVSDLPIEFRHVLDIHDVVRLYLF